MIAINSTGYPCLAVIQHFNIPPEKHAYVYELGRKHLEAWLATATEGPKPLNDLPAFEHIAEIGLEATQQLWENYYNAAREHKWGPFNVH
jgi:hypothetical protein